MEAYKYMKKDHLESALQQGYFRIGTLFDYRDLEIEEIGDPNEGTIIGRSHIHSWNSKNPFIKNEHANSFVSGNGVVIRSGQSITIGNGGNLSIGPNSVSMNNVSLSSTFSVSDSYIFSMSSDYNSESMKKLDCDLCLKINDVDGFINEISLLLEGVLILCSPVQYKDRVEFYENVKTTNPALIKEKNFSYQKEVRAIWTAHVEEYKPTFVKSDKLRQFCEKVNR